ncbi:hypothetical protein JBE27_41570, partial [Streptomyces albiflaviniger]|nr:hypothetical protein [Streptomyces albiflaviniger]
MTPTDGADGPDGAEGPDGADGPAGAGRAEDAAGARLTVRTERAGPVTTVVLARPE